MSTRSLILIMCTPFLLQLSARAQNVPALTSKNASHEADATWKANASGNIEESQYLFKPVDEDQYAAINQRNKLGFIANAQGYEVKQVITNPSETSFDLKFMIESVQNKPTGDALHVNVSDPSRLVYNYKNIDVEYNNTPSGLRQNFVIKNRIGKRKLNVRLEIESSLDYSLDKNNSLTFKNDEGKIAMAYDGLKVWDANHKSLHAFMKLAGNILTLEVDDRFATYPVTIDPLNHTFEWSTSSDALLPALLTNTQLQIDALYGYSSAGLGDINNDGYDDVAVGAPGAVDIVAATTFLQAGAVFVYYGSAAGLSPTPSKVLWANTPIAGALFGYSIAAGDIVGNSRNDIIVGAPLDSYTAQAATAVVGTSPTTVTAGKVYIFRGEDLSASTPSAFAEVKLDGAGLLSNGIAGLLASNVAVKALFGFSVAAADDLNGDSKADLVVGVPGYVGINLLSVRSGGAFVYYSNNLSTTTPVQLTTPGPSLLGLVTLPLANTDGLLFGFSVDGAGDYNADGYPDVVVGAPAGINLNSLAGIFSGKLLSGSAYVFYGNGSGINASTTTRLDPAAGGLLATVPNLQGYTVKGVRNNSRIRTGAILVGAPAGNVLSNIVSGLKLKTGSVNVYKSHTTGVVTPSQTITSPRGSSLLAALSGQVTTVSALFGASMDNVMDVNCDGVSDIIVGEPLSTDVGMIGVNAVGGAAIVLSGNADGSYNTTPLDMITTITSMDLGVNVASMLGTSVTGAGLTYGNGFAPRMLAGAPGKSLDFGSGLLNLGSTLSTLMSFTSVNNGIGKAFEWTTGSCSILPATLLTFQGVKADSKSELSWNTTSEINVAGFEVLHSTDGVKYTVAGKMNSNTRKEGISKYKWLDETPAQGVNYYRLRIIDNDLKVTLSGIVQLNFDVTEAAAVKVVPNPVTGSVINVQMSGVKPGAYRIDLVSATGGRLQSVQARVTASLQTVTMNRKNVSAGMYSVNVYDSRNTLIKADRIVILAY